MRMTCSGKGTFQSPLSTRFIYVYCPSCDRTIEAEIRELGFETWRRMMNSHFGRDYFYAYVRCCICHFEIEVPKDRVHPDLITEWTCKQDPGVTYAEPGLPVVRTALAQIEDAQRDWWEKVGSKEFEKFIDEGLKFWEGFDEL